MNALAERLARQATLDGPMSVAQFMTMALHDPYAGYYATRSPVGAEGDFITAPEISQVFGELLGAWLVQAWRDQGCPSRAHLVELGPGRGTLMADVLHAAKLDRRMLESIDVVLVETSDRLRSMQAERLKHAPAGVRWLTQFDDSLTDRPLFLLANEFFDALPIRQFVRTDRGWCERMIGVDHAGALHFALSPAPIALDIPAERGVAEPGAVYEACPTADAIVQKLAHVIRSKGGAALIADYGYDGDAGFGETLQAVRNHEFTGILDAPGEADLSAHVDFAALCRTAGQAEAVTYGPVPQGQFLTSLGILERAERLCARGGLFSTPSVRLQVERLIAADQMGTLFKAMAILPPGAPRPAGF